MLNFIICDDNKKTNEKTKKIITKVMMPRNDEYLIHYFNDYTKEFKNVINSSIGDKIYILDIELPTKSGIDIAREIRIKDWNSIIIILTAHYELKQEAFKNRLMLLDYISKYDASADKLLSSIELSLNIVGKNQNLNIISDRITYRIALKDIVYIFRETIDRKIIIKTEYSEYMVNKSLIEIKNQLNKNFYQTHRSAIVNINYIETINYKEGIITFKSGSSINFLSESQKKGLKDYVENNP